MCSLFFPGLPSRASVANSHELPCYLVRWDHHISSPIPSENCVQWPRGVPTSPFLRFPLFAVLPIVTPASGEHPRKFVCSLNPKSLSRIKIMYCNWYSNDILHRNVENRNTHHTPCTAYKSGHLTNTTFRYMLFIPKVTEIYRILKFTGISVSRYPLTKHSGKDF